MGRNDVNSDKQTAPGQVRPILNPAEDVLGGGVRGEVAGCPTGGSMPSEVTADEPDGNARGRRPSDESAGGADDSPYETVPSGRKRAAARRPQNAAPHGGGS
jgi:hypothetical protein